MVCEMSTRQDLALGMRTLQRLSELVQKPALLHSDQGMLYTHAVFRKRAAELRLKQSYSRKGNCWDNAVMEGWNGTLKTEWLYWKNLAKVTGFSLKRERPRSRSLGGPFSRLPFGLEGSWPTEMGRMGMP